MLNNTICIHILGKPKEHFLNHVSLVGPYLYLGKFTLEVAGLHKVVSHDDDGGAGGRVGASTTAQFGSVHIRGLSDVYTAVPSQPAAGAGAYTCGID